MQGVGEGMEPLSILMPTLIVSCTQLSETTGQYRHTLHNSIDYIT